MCGARHGPLAGNARANRYKRTRRFMFPYDQQRLSLRLAMDLGVCLRWPAGGNISLVKAGEAQSHFAELTRCFFKEAQKLPLLWPPIILPAVPRNSNAISRAFMRSSYLHAQLM